MTTAENRPNNPFKNGERTPKSYYDFVEGEIILDEIKRRGWEIRGVENPETVGEHTREVISLVWMEAERGGLKTQRAILMARLHDLPEILTGDITPYDNKGEGVDLRKWNPLSEEEVRLKRERECGAVHKLTRGLPPKLRQEYREAWGEYARGETPEARLVHWIDVRQRLLKAKHYYDAFKKLGKTFEIESFIEEGLLSDDPETRRIARRYERQIKGEKQ